MEMSKVIPDIVVGRLPMYLRALQRMAEEGRHITSSQELGERLGISAAQIRKDLSQFGEFGKQGTGYSIDYLSKQICHILKVDQVWNIVVVGAGDIGSAVARYQGFANRGFRVAMLFDNDPNKIGTQVGQFSIQDTIGMKLGELLHHLTLGSYRIRSHYFRAAQPGRMGGGGITRHDSNLSLFSLHR